MSGQPAPKYFGKYNSLEEAQKGWDNTVDELVKFKQMNSDMQSELQATRDQNKQLADLTQQLAQAPQPAPAPQPKLVDDEGNLDVSNLLGAIDNQLATLKQEMSQEVVQVVKEALSPVVNFQESKSTYVGSDKSNVEFTDAEFQRALANPTYAKVFNTLLSNPETAKAAYSTVYDMWNSNRPAPTTGPTETPESRARKEAGGSPDPLGGFPAAPQAAQDQEEIKKLSDMAKGVQDLMNPDAQIAFAKEFVKGGKLQGMLDSLKPEWED